MKPDIREVARELADFADICSAGAVGRMPTAAWDNLLCGMEEILLKHFPAEPQPVAMEAVVERIYDSLWNVKDEVQCKSAIRAELAPVETLLRECHSELNIARARLDTQHQCQVSQDTVCWQWEHHRLKAWSKLISQIDTILGETPQPGGSSSSG